jgi:hypothetical protein
MDKTSASMEYEVLSPWADTDPVPTARITDRLSELSGKTIGMFRNSKRAAPLILTTLETKFKNLYPAIKFSHFTFMPNNSVVETEDKARFESWLKQVDAVVFAYGD